MVTLEIRLLGGFDVAVAGVPVPADAWTRRHAASLVKLLALAPGHRLHREQVIDALWHGLSLEAAAPRLHKAAHYARRALGPAAGSLVLRHETVSLGADGDVRVDAEEFRRLGERALGDRDTAGADSALALYAGPLLPEDIYEAWTEQDRETLRDLRLALLRLTERWEEVVREEPTDEAAHLALVRASDAAGDVRAALRQLERLDQALRRELGTAPGAEAQALRARLEQRAPEARTAGPGPSPVGRGRRLFGRRDAGDELRRRLDEAGAGRGGTLMVEGPAGVGKTAVLDLADALARRRGWRVGRGTASAVEGPWPYAPVLEALSDLCRQHPALLDGLDDVYRLEIDRALSGRDMTWSGETTPITAHVWGVRESGHQRLFVAAAELIRLAATGHGLLLVVDDVHEADEASLRLLHYLSRCAVSEPVLILLAHRPLVTEPHRQMALSLLERGTGARLDLDPLSPEATLRLLAERFPDLPAATAEHIATVSGGVPFLALEMARRPEAGASVVLPSLPAAVLLTFERVALLGVAFTTDELLAIAGTDEDTAYHHLDTALDALVVEPADAGYRFRHTLVREALVGQMSPRALTTARREVAEALAGLPGPPGRVAHLFLAAGLPRRAVPFVLRAVETAGALGAYRDGLALVEGVREHAGPDDLPRLLARRGDLLLALGDPSAVAAYQEAVAVTEGTEHRLVRARLARAASLAGDFDTARAALADVALEGDLADGLILLARGNLAYFTGDVETAWKAAGEARRLLHAPDDPWYLMDLVSLQGLIAHQRGEWFERFRMELRRTQGKQRLVTAVFDAHLCVAEFLLYGPVPYDEVIAETEDLRRQARDAGALRGVAFATALIGEAAFLSGDLDRAERELAEAVDLHRDVDAAAGEAHSLQRLAEVRLARGDRVEAGRLLQQALPLARWSVIGMHLLQRVYGTMIAAAADPDEARAVVDRAEATLGDTDHCPFCDVMLAVPAAIACADVGDLDSARRHLAVAEESAARWEGSAWRAAVLEARSHLVRAEGRPDDADELVGRAGGLFRAAGQDRDAQRCDALAALARVPR